MTRWALGLALLECWALAAVGAGPASEIDPQWLARAKAELQPAYDRYDALSSQVEEEYEQRWENDPADSRSKKSRNKTLRVSLVRSGSNSRYEVTTAFDGSTKQPSTRLDCNNEEYHFTLTKPAPSAPYVLVGYVPKKLPVHVLSAVGGAVYRSAYSEYYLLLPAVHGQSAFRLKAIRWDEAKRLVYVRFSAKDNEKTPAIDDEELWVDPANHWRIVEMIKRIGGVVVTQILTYGPSVEGLTFPARIDASYIAPSKHPEPSCKCHTTVLRVEKTKKTPSDFRLSAFGLPEPVGKAPAKRIPNYVWLLAAAVASAVLALGCWHLGRRWRVPAAGA